MKGLYYHCGESFRLARGIKNLLSKILKSFSELFRESVGPKILPWFSYLAGP